MTVNVVMQKYLLDPTIVECVIALPDALQLHFWLSANMPDLHNEILARAVEHVGICMKTHKVRDVFPLTCVIEEKC